MAAVVTGTRLTLRVSRMTFIGGGRACMYVLLPVTQTTLSCNRLTAMILGSGFKFSQLEMSRRPPRSNHTTRLLTMSYVLRPPALLQRSCCRCWSQTSSSNCQTSRSHGTSLVSGSPPSGSTAQNRNSRLRCRCTEVPYERRGAPVRLRPPEYGDAYYAPLRQIDSHPQNLVRCSAFHGQ